MLDDKPCSRLTFTELKNILMVYKSTAKNKNFKIALASPFAPVSTSKSGYKGCPLVSSQVSVPDDTSILLVVSKKKKIYATEWKEKISLSGKIDKHSIKIINYNLLLYDIFNIGLNIIQRRFIINKTIKLIDLYLNNKPMFSEKELCAKDINKPFTVQDIIITCLQIILLTTSKKFNKIVHFINSQKIKIDTDTDINSVCDIITNISKHKFLFPIPELFS